MENAFYKSRKTSLDNLGDTNSSASFMRFLVNFIKMLKNSEGRNKVCGLIQYICKFSAACIIYTIDANEIKSNILDIELIYDRHSNLKRIEKSMSNGRKIFRFLKFIEDLRKFSSYLYDSSFDFITILKAFTTLSGCFYHLLDNLVWASNVGIMNRIISGELKWKTSKNFFSLLKTLIKLTTNILNFKECFYKEFHVENSENLFQETLKNRSRLRMISLNIFHTIIKLITLFFSLKIEPFYSLLHPVIVSLCGILYCVISIYKVYEKNKEFQYKMLKNYRRSSAQLVFNGRNNLRTQSYKEKSLNQNTPNVHLKRIKSFEYSLLERQPNQRLLEDEDYFEHYYIDFNKDYPIMPKNVLKEDTYYFHNIIT